METESVNFENLEHILYKFFHNFDSDNQTDLRSGEEIETDSFSVYDAIAYSEPPSFKLEIKDDDDEEETEENDEETEEQEEKSVDEIDFDNEPGESGIEGENINHVNQMPLRSYRSVTEIRRVPRTLLGYNILGRAFIYTGIIEIASDLYGNDFEEVKLHEMLHIQNPTLGEGEIRRLTKETLPFTPRFH